jgi:uncharacterized protein YjbI with pentapeptide repeats
VSNSQHQKWLKQGVSAWNDRRKNDPFTPNLKGIDLQGVSLKGSNLKKKAKEISATPHGANLDGVDLHGADMRGANLEGADFHGANLQGANFEGANLYEAWFRTADLREVNFKKAELQGAEFAGANLAGADFSLARLYAAQLEGQDLRCLNFAGANLESIYFEGSDLREAKFEGANLREADLRGVNVRTVETSKLSATQSGYTDLSNIEITFEQIRTMIGDTGTILPDGMKHPDHWPVLENDDTEVREETSSYVETTPTTASSPKSNTKKTARQVTLILQTAVAAKSSASIAAANTQHLIEEFHRLHRNQNNPAEVIFLTGLKETFQRFEDVLEKDQSNSARIQELEELLKASKKQNKKLLKALNKANKNLANVSSNQSSFGRDLAVATMGSLAPQAFTQIASTLGYLHGIFDPEIINGFWSLYNTPTEAPLDTFPKVTDV